MARPGLTPEQQELIRQRIRQAASDIYREEGLGGISARAIARRAEVSVGTIYGHFRDLPALMQSLWAGRVERETMRMRGIAARNREPRARLEALLREYLRFAIEDAELYRHAFLFVRPGTHPRPDTLPLEAVGFGELLCAAIRDAQAAGIVRPGSPDELAQIVWSGLHGCVALPQNLDRVAFRPAADIAEPMVSVLMAGLRADAGLALAGGAG